MRFIILLKIQTNITNLDQRQLAKKKKKRKKNLATSNFFVNNYNINLYFPFFNNRNMFISQKNFSILPSLKFFKKYFYIFVKCNKTILDAGF